jgi:hypothetical protein
MQNITEVTAARPGALLPYHTEAAAQRDREHKQEGKKGRRPFAFPPGGCPECSALFVRLSAGQPLAFRDSSVAWGYLRITKNERLLPHFFK